MSATLKHLYFVVDALRTYKDFHSGEWPDCMYVFDRSQGLEDENIRLSWARAVVGGYLRGLLRSRGERQGGSGHRIATVEMGRCGRQPRKCWLVMNWIRAEEDGHLRGQFWGLGLWKLWG